MGHHHTDTTEEKVRPPLWDHANFLDREDHDMHGLDCSQDKDQARQEFKHEANINTIMDRFKRTGMAPAMRQPVFGDHDFDLDLHGGFIALAEADRAFLNLPRELREKYGNPHGMLDAVHSGEMRKDLAALQEARETAALDAADARAAAAADHRAKRDAAAQAKAQEAEGNLRRTIESVVQSLGLKK